MTEKKRQFTDHEATREATPLLFGVIGASGSGKTYSALRLATGMQRVVGGDIWCIDTEHRRARHYAPPIFEFRHIDFKPPFSPLDYLSAIEHCVNKGAKIIIVDSMSHEHEGQGGVLEWHEAEVERLMKAWSVSADKAKMPAWAKPKQARRKLINGILQLGPNMIFCFRAKEKVKLGGGEVKALGYMPIAGEEFVYELTGKALLMPGAEGVPTWNPENPGEKMMTKLPQQFREIFTGKAGKPLDEDTGEQLARWAAGGDAKPAEPALTARYGACRDRETFRALEEERAALWDARSLTASARRELKDASDAARRRIDGPSGNGQEQASLATMADGFIERIDAAPDMTALTKIGREYQESSLDRVEFDRVTSAYNERMEHLLEAQK